MAEPGAARLLTFFLWRMTVYGFALGALAGGAFIVLNALLASVIVIVTGRVDLDDGSAGSAVGGVYVIGAVAVYGALGAVYGAALGLICGFVLALLTLVSYSRRWRPDTAGYRKVVSWACAGTAVLAPIVAWLASGYPNLEDFGLLRFTKNSIVSPEPSTFNVVVYVVLPALELALPMWLAGRTAARRYIQEFVEADHAGRARSSSG